MSVDIQSSQNLLHLMASLEQTDNNQVKWPVDRKSAFSRFERLGIPNRRDEEWKYTGVKSFNPELFFPAEKGSHAEEIQVAGHNYASEVNLLVFCNGFFIENLSNVIDEGDFIIDRLSGPSVSADDLKFFGSTMRENDAFEALNTALAPNSAIIIVRSGSGPTHPVHIKHLHHSKPDVTNTGAAKSSHQLNSCRALIVASSQSRIDLTEEHILMDGSEQLLVNCYSEVICESGATVNMNLLQNADKRLQMVHTIEVNQKRDSRFESVTVSSGATMIRNNLNVALNQPGASCELRGLYLNSEKSHIDNHLMVDHVSPDCTSDQHYKGIIKEESRAVFNGKIIVRPDAQRTNAYQSNRNLLLSNDATVNTKPQLEIFADDVKCSHGATCGQLDPEAMFYLMARGISEDNAKNMLGLAFASEVTNAIVSKQIREKLNQLISEIC